MGTGLLAAVVGAPAGAATRHLLAHAQSKASAHAQVAIKTHALKAGNGGAGLSGPSGSASGTTPAASNASAGGTQPGGSSVLHLGDRVLKQGMRGRDVRVLQDFLTRVGFATTIDGDFGPATASNVRAFERSQGLPVDGIVSAHVNRVLRAVVAKAQKSSNGPVGQAILNANGTVTAPAGAPATIRNVIAAANRIAFKPYIYGGGHATWNDSGYDCSGSVSYALHGANLLDSPMASGEFESYGNRGRGRWITIYTNPSHMFMVVAGMRFDTVAQDSSNNNDRWTNVAASSWEGSFVVRHPAGW